MIKDRPILETARFPFIGVTDNGFRRPRRFGDRLPLETSRETSPTTTSQFTLADMFNHIGRLHFGKGALQSNIAGGRTVAVQRRAARLANGVEDTLLDPTRIGRWQGCWHFD